MQFEYPVLEQPQAKPNQVVRPQAKPAKQQPVQKVVYKPVYVAAQPIQQVYLQPQAAPKRVVQRPLTLDEKIAKSKENIEYESTRIAYCSYLFIGFGLVSMFMSLKELTDARLKSIFIVQEKQIPWGNANYTGWSWPNVTVTTQSRPEQIIYDSIWNMMFFSTMVSFFLFAMGKTALRATQKQKSRVTERMFNRHFFMFLAFLVFYVFTRKQSRLFKSTFEYIQTHDNLTASYYDTDAAVVNMTTNMTETPKRNLRERFHARNDQYDNVLQQHEQMFEDIDMQFDKAFSQQIPDDFKKVMKMMKKHHNSKKHDFQRMRFEDDDHYYNHEEDHKESPLNFKRDIYRIYAPALWNKAQEEDARRAGHHHHGPNVMADKDAVKDWPKMNAMCPVILFFIFACIHQICRIKFLEKELAKLEFLYKAKKLIKKTVKKQVAAVAAEEQPEQALYAAPQTVQVVTQMPVAQKKCKKAAKAKYVVAQPQLIMPVMSKKIDDVEAIPQINESFDYSMTDPLVDEITYAPDTFSSTGVGSVKNSMM